MPLATTSFPIGLFLFVTIVPLLALAAIIAAVLFFFWRFRSKPKVWMMGIVVLLGFCLLSSSAFVLASMHRTYRVAVVECDARGVEGRISSGFGEGEQYKRFYFPLLFGTGQSSWGDGATVQLRGGEGRDSVYPNMICQTLEQIEAPRILLETDGLRRIKSVQFVKEEE